MAHVELSKANTSETMPQIFPDAVLMGQQPLRCIVVAKIWKSRQNGMVYDPNGISPCLCVGAHSGVEPKIIVREE